MSENLVVRLETEGDQAAIREIHRVAFADHPYSKQTEHLIVDALRDAGALPLSLVADVGGVVVGHVAFSPVAIGEVDSNWYILGPIGVIPELQRLGIGSALVLAGLSALSESSIHGCVLVGDPDFYGRLGFRQADSVTCGDVPQRNILYVDFGFPLPVGELHHHEAFDISA